MNVQTEKWDPGAKKGESRITAWLTFIRVEHTIFSLPFIYAGALLVVNNLTITQIIMLFLALFGLRTFGISINNIVDYPIDKLNPRTKQRHLASGIMTLGEAWGIAIAGAIIFFVASYFLNIYALMFSPLVLLVIGTYPYAKRWHYFPHLHLGVALGFSVAGGAIAVMNPEKVSLSQAIINAPWIYVIAITLWVAGFDTIYSIMDIDFDKEYGLGSIPARYGEKNAKTIAKIMHLASLALLYYAIQYYRLGIYTIITTIITTILIIYQHYLANINKIKESFNTNLLISITITLGIILDKIAAIM